VTTTQKSIKPGLSVEQITKTWDKGFSARMSTVKATRDKADGTPPPTKKGATKQPARKPATKKATKKKGR
jgi:hypothetical protein